MVIESSTEIKAAEFREIHAGMFEFESYIRNRSKNVYLFFHRRKTNKSIMFLNLLFSENAHVVRASHEPLVARVHSARDEREAKGLGGGRLLGFWQRYISAGRVFTPVIDASDLHAISRKCFPAAARLLLAGCRIEEEEVYFFLFCDFFFGGRVV